MRRKPEIAKLNETVAPEPPNPQLQDNWNRFEQRFTDLVKENRDESLIFARVVEVGFDEYRRGWNVRVSGEAVTSLDGNLRLTVSDWAIVEFGATVEQVIAEVHRLQAIVNESVLKAAKSLKSV